MVCTHLILTGNGRGMPGVQVTVPEIKLQSLCATTEMEGVTRACYRAVGRRGSRSSVVGDIRHIAAP